MNLNALLEWDLRTSSRLRLNRSGPIRSAAAVLAHSGDSWIWLGGLALLWVLGNQQGKQLAVVMAGSIIVTAVLVLSLKFLVRRPRPEGQWGHIYRKTDPHSFPSGHAARAFMLAVVALGLAPTWFALLVVIWAPLVALARVLMGVHFIIDISVGILIGLLMGLLCLYAAQRLFIV
jgi:undecaprenyl-diphosphatase